MKLDVAQAFRLAPGRATRLLFARVLLAVGLPLVGGVAAGQPEAAASAGATALLVSLSDIGSSRKGRLASMAATLAAIIAAGGVVALFGSGSAVDELLVLACAAAASSLGGVRPGLAATSRFAAMAAMSATGLHVYSALTLAAVVGGGAIAIGAAWASWRIAPDEADDVVLDWRAGMRPVLGGARAGWRFAVCTALAALVTIVAGEQLHLTRSYWATLTVIMVMQREGLVSLRLLLLYAAGTLLGVIGADALWHLGSTPIRIAVLATAAASARWGFELNPALGVAGFTAFVILMADLAQRPFADPTWLLTERLIDVGIGGALALAGTLLAEAWRRAALRR